MTEAVAALKIFIERHKTDVARATSLGHHACCWLMFYKAGHNALAGDQSAMRQHALQSELNYLPWTFVRSGV